MHNKCAKPIDDQYSALHSCAQFSRRLANSLTDCAAAAAAAAIVVFIFYEWKMKYVDVISMLIIYT